MAKKDYAIIFERGQFNKEKGYPLRVLDYVEGEERTLKGGKKIFIISETFKKHYEEMGFDNDPFYEYLFKNQNIPFMEERDSFNSKYVYGAPTNMKVFKQLINYNISLSVDEAVSKIKEEDIIDTVENFKDEYVEALRLHDFYQICDKSGEINTYYERKEPIKCLVSMSDILESIIYEELELEIPEDYSDTYKSMFKKLPEKLDVKKIYEECKKYIIGQDEHILPILCGINDNLMAEIPEEKTNILVCGSTGVGKTAIFKRISELIGIPIIIENASQFTKAGYVGRNVDDIFEDLLEAANNDIDLAQRGIIIIDEIDKKASGKDDSVSGVGVLHSLLKLLEGGDYMYETGKGSFSELKKFNTLKTTIAFGGAFSGLSDQCVKKEFGFGKKQEVILPKAVDIYDIENLSKYGIPPEFVGRIQLLELLNTLDEKDLKKILTEAIINPYALFVKKMKKYNTVVKNDESFINAVAAEAYRRKTGARGLYSTMKDATKLAEAEVSCTPLHYKKELILTPECIQDNKSYTLKRVYNNRKSTASK